MDKRIYITYLYDFYYLLLTDRQQSIFVDYYFNDFSLNEIADKLSITKQGVRSTLVTTENLLNEYEEKLSLFKKFDERNSIFEKLMTTDNIEEINKFIIELKKI